MLDPESLALGGTSVAVVAFVMKALWNARERKIAKNEDDLDARRAADLSEIKGDVRQIKERVEGVSASHRADIEALKLATAQLDTRVGFREGRYGAEPLTNSGARPSSALLEYRAAQTRKLEEDK